MPEDVQRSHAHCIRLLEEDLGLAALSHSHATELDAASCCRTTQHSPLHVLSLATRPASLYGSARLHRARRYRGVEGAIVRVFAQGRARDWRAERSRRSVQGLGMAPGPSRSRAAGVFTRGHRALGDDRRRCDRDRARSELGAHPPARQLHHLFAYAACGSSRFTVARCGP